MTIIDPDQKGIRDLAKAAAYATSGIPKIVVLEEVSDSGVIEKFKLPETPAIVINGELKVTGKYLDHKGFRELFFDHLKASSQ